MFRRHVPQTVLAAGVSLAFVAQPALAGAAGPGAPGIGDPYYPGYGNGGYDVSHYDVRLRYQPANDQLDGTTTILAQPTRDLSSFHLDFALNVTSVRVNGTPAGFERRGTELSVTPPSPVAGGEPMNVVVDYSDVPSRVDGPAPPDEGTPWRHAPGEALVTGQPESAAWWYPSNDHPRDKATHDISVAVPDGTKVVSNGVNTGKSSQLGWTRWNWRSSNPAASYLAFLAIGPYDVRTKPGFRGQPFVSAYAPGLGDAEGAARASVERTPEAVEFLSGEFGEYPFEAQGGVVPRFPIGFALETQTRSVYSPKFFTKGANTSVVAHENAHQWFGDSVSVHNWRDIWLNEGFASFSEWLWSEHRGEGTAQQLMDHYYQRYPADDPFWQVLPGDPGPENNFHDAVYDRGAMAVQALRNVVGDQKFHEIVRTWLAERRDGNATIEQFVEHANRVSGADLSRLFDTWLFTPGKPARTPENGFPPGPAPQAAGVPASVAQIDHTHQLLGHEH